MLAGGGGSCDGVLGAARSCRGGLDSVRVKERWHGVGKGEEEKKDRTHLVRREKRNVLGAIILTTHHFLGKRTP